eukprot:TRINITY_DN9582_c0_g5_i2.p1 TRINITY_DN9582_c0_g5~~TRINITY_DN9582_c0_g5_i2.p1  ORF type:complete len:394 (-),score=89.00 TRINITY_DN9582_c0_g5_i2:142-1323(-)
MRQSKRQRHSSPKLPPVPSLSVSTKITTALEGLCFPQEEQVLPQWLQQAKLQWRLTRQQARAGMGTLPCYRSSAEALAKAETDASIRDGCAVAAQLGNVARANSKSKPRARTSVDWKARALVSDSDSLELAAMAAPEWTEEMRQLQYRPPRGPPAQPTVQQTHEEHLKSLYGNSHGEQDGFMCRKLSSVNQRIQQLVQGLSNGIDTMERLCESPCEGTPEELQSRSEMMARLGLLVHLSFSSNSLDEVDYRTLTHGAAAAKDKPRQEPLDLESDEELSEEQPSGSLLQGTVEMNPWDGAGVAGWQVLTTTTEGSKRPKQTFFSPTGKQFASASMVKRYLNDSGADSALDGMAENELLEGPRDRVCSECKPKHRTVETCRGSHKHTAPNWNWRK